MVKTNKQTFLEKLRTNPFMVMTFVLLLLLFILLFNSMIEEKKQDENFIFNKEMFNNSILIFINNHFLNCSIENELLSCKEINLTDLKGGKE